MKNIWQSQELRNDNKVVFSADFSPDGTKLVTAGERALLDVWKQLANRTWVSQNLAENLNFDEQNFIQLFNVFSSDSSWLFAESAMSVVYLWSQQPDTSWSLLTTFSSASNATFTDDKTTIVSNVDVKQRHLILWKLNNNGGIIRSQSLGDATTIDPEISPNGMYLVAGIINTVDGTIEQQEPQMSGVIGLQIWSKIDHVGTTNVAEKIMLLQLLDRDGGSVMLNRPYLQKIFNYFTPEAQKNLTIIFDIPPFNNNPQ